VTHDLRERDTLFTVGHVVSPQLRAAYEHIDDGVILSSPDERVVYVNAAFERLAGYGADEVVGRLLADVLHPRAVADEPDVFAMTRASGAEYFVRRKRATLDAALAGAPLLFETHHDVTAERALRDAEALYRKLTERSRDLVSRTDASARCIYMSPSCRAILGYEPDELVGSLALVNLAHPEDRARREQVRERFVAEGRTSGSPVRMRVRRKDGTYVWLETLTHIERDAESRIVEVQSWARDVSAAVAAEQALAQSEASFRSLLERMPAGVAVHRDGTILYANAALVKMTGRERAEEIVGRSLLELIHPAERPAVEGRLKDTSRTGAVSRRRRIIAADGTERLLEVTAVPLVFEGEIAFVAICHDITEHERMEQRLALAERMALVGRLASGVGHEINNPLAYMLGSIELARGDLDELSAEVLASDRIDRLEGHLVTVREGAERVRDIVRDLKLLSVARDDRLGPVDVERALDVAASTVQHEIRQRARLAKEYGGVPLALSSEGRLAQVFVNLLVNAAQAIPDGDANDNEIRITTREVSGSVVVEIRDTGIGIAPSDLPRIFEPFFTTKPHGVGTGLGLSISHTIITAHGGKLTAERLPSRGTLFRVELRAACENVAEAAAPDSMPMSGPRARVLVVDDEPHVARVIAQLLAPHEVTLAHSGRDAVTCLGDDAAFDAIVCDLQMNDGTGVDVYEHLVEHAPSLADRIIFTTGGAFTQRAKDFLDRCPQPVLEKPFEAATLASLVGKVARRSAR
jgi:PAS domain S-box-containing protein